MNPNYRHVVFDLDGTLADTARDIASAANHARRAHGFSDLSVDAVRECIGEGARQLVSRVIPEATEHEIDAALHTFLDHYEAHILDETRLYEGIEALLGALADGGVTCSVLSNKPAALCRQVLLGLGVGRHFVEVVGGDSLSARKPDPCGLKHLQSRLCLHAGEILFVGDSLVDWQTADAADVGFCGVLWGFAGDALPRAAATVVTHPDEIRTLVFGDGDQSRASRLSS